MTRNEDLSTSPPRTRQELIAAAAMAARLHQNDYDRFEDAAAEFERYTDDGWK
jgi:hypothetical protein